MGILNKLMNKKDKPKNTEDTSKKDNVEQQEEDDNIVTKVKGMYKRAYESKADLHVKWKKNYKAYTGELFDKQVPEFRSNEVSNYVFSTIETIKPIMLSNNPKTQVIPRSGEFFEKARVVQCVLDSEWKRARMFGKLHLLNHLNLIYGTAITGMFWNAGDKNGLGNVESTLISPFNFFVEPSATELSNAEYCMYAVYKKVSEVCKVFPDKSEEIKKEATSYVDENLMSEKEGTDFGTNNVLYIECYMRDYSQESYIEEELNQETGLMEKFEVKKRKYPNGRRVIIAGDVLLEDGENPYEDAGEFPFEVMRCYPQHGTFWGISEVEMIISPQEHANRIMNGIIENALLNGNPWTIIDNNSGIEKSSLSNRPGLVIRKNPGSEVRRDAPPPLPAYISQIVDTLKNDIQEISGVFDVVKGERPGSITAASAIQALNEQAQGRIRLKVQGEEEFISRIGSMWIRRIQQYWVTMRTVRVAGNPIQSDMLTNPMLMQNGASIQFMEASKDELDGDYDIEVFAGSTMQTNKSAIAQTVIQLAQTVAEDGMPMLSRKTVLETILDVIPQINIQEILDYFDGMKQQQAQAQSEQTQALQEQEQMKMQQEAQMQQVQAQHEMGIKNMEHASKLTVERSKEDAKLKEIKAQSENVSGNDNPLQSDVTDVKYKKEDTGQVSGEDEINKIIEWLLSLPQDEYNKVIAENPELQQIVQAVMDGQGGDTKQ